MEFRHLQSFLAIAQELHFGRAAARLHLTQPSLSQQLQRLERTLGVELVARTSHEVRLTPAGRAFETHARAIVASVDRAALTAKEAAAGRTGTINVGFNYPAAQHILPGTLAKMSADYPKVTVGLWEKRTGPQLAALADGDLDVALTYGHPVGTRFRYQRLISVPLVALVGPRHPWAGRPGVPFEEMANQPCVLFGRDQSPAMYDTILAAAQRSGIALDIARVVDDSAATGIVVSVTSLVGFTSLTRGLSVGPGAGDGRAAGGGPRPVVVRLYDPVPNIDLYAVWRSDGDEPGVAAFLDCIEASRSAQAASAPEEARVAR